jgi:hypothetical protein
MPFDNSWGYQWSQHITWFMSVIVYDDLGMHSWQNLLHSYCLMTVCLNVWSCTAEDPYFLSNFITGDKKLIYVYDQKTNIPVEKCHFTPSTKEKSMYNQMAKSGWQFSIMTQLFNTTIFTKIWIRLSIEEF